MLCSNCGATVSNPRIPYCTNCGQPLPAAPGTGAPVFTQAPAPTSSPAIAYIPIGSSLVGVQGWLLLFCVLLTIIFPGMTVFGVVITLRYNPFDATSMAFLTAGVILDSVGIVAGALLWRRRRSGLPLAKGVLIGRILFPFASLGSIFLRYGSQVRLGPATFIRLALLPVALNTVWYLYLLRSERVRATYFGEGAQA